MRLKEERLPGQNGCNVIFSALHRFADATGRQEISRRGDPGMPSTALTELASQCNLEWLRSFTAGRLPRGRAAQLQGVGLENGKRGFVPSLVVRSFVAISVFSLAAVMLAGSGTAAAQVPVYTPPTVAANTSLANIKYDYRWEIYGGVAYSHFNAGPNLLQGSNLGGFDIQAAHWFRQHWALAGDARGYFGTSGVVPNIYGIRGPAVSEQMYMGGPEYRALSNPHASLTLHAFVGAAHGSFDSALQDQNGNPVPPNALGLFNNQTSFGGAFGGAIDLNRSQNLAFRISPDATLTNFGGAGIHEQFAISVGVIYRLDQVGRKKRK